MGVFILAGLALGGFYLLSLMGPRPVDIDRTAQPVDRGQAVELLGESQRLESRFRQVSAMREPRDEDLQLLLDAIERQQDYLSAVGGFDRQGSERLQTLRKLYQDHAAAPVRVESVEAEMQAHAHELREERTEALAGYRRAMDLQRRINERFPLSEHRDVGRLTQLERHFRVLEGRPLYERSQEAETMARQALETSQWDEALEHLQIAIDTQRQLNNRYRGFMYADMQRLGRLERELVSLQTSDAHGEIEQLVERGRAAAERLEHRQAADYFQQAARRQRRLNVDSPQSHFASAAQLEALEVKAENALSRELGERILKEVHTLQEHLRARSIWQATEVLQALEPQAQRFRESFPRSELLSEDMLRKLQFLALVQDDLALFQERIYGQLLPIPEHDAWHMAKTEVPQALYTSIMLSNPSRNRGERQPVDSVNWHDAHEFCQKVSWILARDVRMPTLAEYRAALGSLRYVDLTAVSWNAENSGMRTHPVGEKEANANGFFDLLGNVAEWLEPGDLPPGETYRVGGDAEDSVDVLADIPVEVVNQRMRNRMTGLRFVVDMFDE